MSAIPVRRARIGANDTRLQAQMRRFTAVSGMTLLAVAVVSIFLMPLVFMIATSFKDRSQLTAPGAPLYPAAPETFEWQGAEYPVYDVPGPDGVVRAWALVEPHREDSIFIDPADPEAGPITWEGRWRTLQQHFHTRAAWGALAGLYALTSVLAATVQLPIGLRTELIDAMVLLGRRPELTGLLIAGQQEWGTGGYFYLHRDVPLVARSGPEARELLSLLAEPRYSHLLVYRDALSEEEVAGAGLCLQQRWGQQVTLWRRCEASAQAAGALGSSALDASSR